MITYSHKDIKIKVNDQNIFCSSLNVSRNVSLEPLFTINNTASNNYYSSDFPAGSVELSYYLTGIDQFYDFVDKPKKYKIDFGGATINSSILSSYELSVESNQLLMASVSLSFYENIGGIFRPVNNTDFLPENIDILKSSEVSTEGDLEIHEGLIKKLSYSYSSQFSPNYVLGGGITPYNLSFKEDSVSLNISAYNYNLNIPVNGQKVNFTLNLKNKNYNTVMSIPISALINSKAMSVDTSNNPIVDLSLIQSNLGELKGEDLPTISSFSPMSGQINSEVNLIGSNFKRIERVMLGEFRCPRYVESTESLFVELPDILPSGYKAPFIIKTVGGKEVFSESGFLVTNGVIL